MNRELLALVVWTPHGRKQQWEPSATPSPPPHAHGCVFGFKDLCLNASTTTSTWILAYGDGCHSTTVIL